MTKSLQKSQDGAAHLLIIVVVVLVAVGAAGFYVYSQQNKDDSVAKQSQSETLDGTTLPSDLDKDDDPQANAGDDQENSGNDEGSTE